MDENNFRKILDEALEPIKTDLAGVQDIVEKRLLPSVTAIELEIKSFKDAYQENNRNMQKLEKRLGTVEADAGIEAPPELRIVDVS